MKIACQTIVWGSEKLFNDYINVLKEVESIGFQGVETNLRVLHKYYPDVLNFVKDKDLKILSAHANTLDLVNESEHMYQEVLPMLSELGAKFLLFSSPENSSLDDFVVFSKELNSFGEQAVKYGIQVCFHNHNWELKDDCKLLRLLVEQTDRKTVGLAVDLGWILRSEVTVSEFISRFGSRVKYMHIKDVKSGIWSELGAGELPLNEVIPEIAKLNLPWLVVEQDTTQKTPIDSMTISFNYLRKQIGAI